MQGSFYGLGVCRLRHKLLFAGSKCTGFRLATCLEIVKASDFKGCF